MTIEAMLTTQLQATFMPQRLQVMNQSQHHLGRLGVESHFKVVLVSAAFVGQNRLARHRAVYCALKMLLTPVGSIHALALHTYTPQEWLQHPTLPPPSPICARSV